MSEKTISFSAVDSWFFRETRPMDANGESQSIFPPGIRTVSGAIRTWIGEQQQVDWQEFKTNKNHPLRQIIGSSEESDLGGLTFKGVWISKQGQRLYPAPLHLMKNEQKLYVLRLAEKGIHCDLGKNIRLPELPCEDAIEAKPLENTWIDEETFLTILNGKKITFSEEHFLTSKLLFSKEIRTGIARDNALRTAKESLLYQTQHIRPDADISLEVDVSGLPDSITGDKALVRLGGESRAASLIVNEKSLEHPAINTKNADLKNAQGIVLYLLSPLLIQYKDYKKQPLPGFTLIEQLEQTSYWQGNIEGVDLKLQGAVVGKSIRDGGWDMAKHQPRDDKSLIPAGSVFFCEITDKSLSETIDKLKGKQLGELQQYGYGQIAVGIWNKG